MTKPDGSTLTVDNDADRDPVTGSNPAQPRLLLDRVSKSYGDRPALTGASLSLGAGTCTAIVGPNGSGKTTLLKLAVGLLSPDTGRVVAMGHAVRPFPAALSGKVMSVIDSIEPPGWSTAQDLIGLYKTLSPAKFDAAIAVGLLAELRIEKKQKYRTLSKGQRRWLLSMLTLACKPDVLILDEPSDGLDPAARPRLYQLIRELVNDTGSSVLFATHILSEVERAADRVLFMTVGEVLFEEDLERLREEVVELELPEGSRIGAEVFRGLVPDAKIIGEHTDQGIRVLTLRLPPGFDREQLKPFGWVRGFNLERFYKALTTKPATTE